MNYRSNLTVPDLRQHFKLKDPPIQIMCHDIPSDPDYEPGCGYWSQDECAILCAVAAQVQGHWLDIGARFAWTAAHIAEMGRIVSVVDPILSTPDGYNRFSENMYNWWNRLAKIYDTGAEEAFSVMPSWRKYAGFVIDGNHDYPYPLMDAVNAYRFRAEGCVILMHDYWGKPIRDAADWLRIYGFQNKVYYTPNGVCLCWRGLPDFVAPEHVRDPQIDWSGVERMLAQ